jgi:hypothetical protein
VESEPRRLAQEQLDSLAACRELALARIALPWRHVVVAAVVTNGCMVSVVLPIVLSEGWTLLIQGAFLAPAIPLLLTQRRQQRVKRPRLRVQGAWVLSVVATVGLGSALAMAIYARSTDDPWLGAVALSMNFAACLVAYGGLSFLLRRQFARLT